VPAPDSLARGARTARRAGYALAAVVAAAIAYDLMRMPVQVSDSLGEILAAQQQTSAAAAFAGSLANSGYLRPLRIAQIKALFDVADGRYQLVYRGFHAMLLVAALLLFTAALRIDSWTDLAAAAFALTVLTGLHTFLGTVQEAFPINHFLEMTVLCLLALNLSQSRGGWLVDIAAAVVFVAASLTLESGLLVAVVVAAAWLVGWRGVSWRGLALIAVLGCGYLWLRFAMLETGVPALTERAAGYGFEVLEPSQLLERFGADPRPFYLYNVIAAIGSVLFSEPRNGVFEGVRLFRSGAVPPYIWIPVVTSTVTTLAIVGGLVAARRSGSTAAQAHARAGLVFVAVLVANALLSFAYTKDEIVSIAGAFYALTAYTAFRWILSSLATSFTSLRFAAIVLIALVGTGWAVRSAGVEFHLVSQAFKQRNDWAGLPMRWRQEGEWPADPRAQALVLQLRLAAAAMPAVAPTFTPRWTAVVYGQ
jgi:hypothetical protein